MISMQEASRSDCQQLTVVKSTYALHAKHFLTSLLKDLFKCRQIDRQTQRLIATTGHININTDT